ncbi:MAG: autotransporter outer membrane beta-barrel domain-containing protein [Hyphomicrobiales bacterium]|jgi:hypothetical protein
MGLGDIRRAFSSTILTVWLTSLSVIFASSAPALAQTTPEGLICAGGPDFPDTLDSEFLGPPATFQAAIVFLNFDADTCAGTPGPVTYDLTASISTPNGVLLVNNLLTDGGQGFTAGTSFSLGANVHNATFNGAPYVSGTQIAAANANGTFIFSYDGQRYQFQIVISGAELQAFRIELAPDQTASQQNAGSNILFQQAGNNISTGVGNAIAERFSGGDGTQASFASNGSAFSAYVSLHGIGHAARDRRAARLAMYEADDALGAIETAFSHSDTAQSETSHALGFKSAADTASTLVQDDAPRLNIWARGTFTHYDGDAFSGDTWNGIAGIDYLITENVLIGLLGGYENGDFTFQANDGAFDGAGVSVGAYVGIRLAESVVLDGFLTHAWLDYDNRAGTVTGSTDATRIMVSMNLTGHYEVADGFYIEPNARIFYAHEQQAAYTQSNGIVAAANSVDSGRVSIGPRLRYTHHDSASGTWSMHASLHGEYDLSSEVQTDTTLPDFDGLLSARAALGVSTTLLNGWSISLDGDIGGLGSGAFTSYSGSGKIRIPFN